MSATCRLVVILLLGLAGCGKAAAVPPAASGSGSTFFVGEGLVGEGNEVAHIDVLIGPKSGPVGQAFAEAIANQKQGHSNILVVLTPNMTVKPSTVAVSKVTISGAKDAVRFFGPAQAAIGKAVTDCVRDGTIPRESCNDWVIVCGVFIQWQASDDQKVFQYNYEATKLAIQRAMRNEPNIDDLLKASTKTDWNP